ncbi:MAG TPA: DUF58 domain-containing protein [Anaerolineales bacterium]|nr:DUF58 domain-containing protein [Anaerolineales bacterium]
MTSRLKLNSRLLPFLVVVLVIMQLTNPSRVWMSLLVGMGGLWLISFVWARNLAQKLNFTREMRYGWAQVGDALEEHFKLENNSPFPVTWVEIEDRSTLPGYNANLATGVDGLSDNQWHKTATCTRRGVYQLGNTVVHTGDPFGIYNVTITDPARVTLMVMPPVVPLPTLEIVPGGFSGDGHPLPNTPERTVEAGSVREYIPGDSLRIIHWKTTARQGKPFVRLFDGAPASNWWILLDLDNAAQIGSGENATDEHAIILAASLADRSLRAHHGVGLILNGKQLEWIPPRTGPGQVWDILRMLALVSRGENSLDQILENIRPNLGKSAGLLIVTSTSKTDWLQRLAPLRWRGITPTVILLDARSFGSSHDNTALTSALKEMGVTYHIIPRELLDRPEARPGTRGKWEWRVSPSGRPIPMHTPEDLGWRKLAE